MNELANVSKVFNFFEGEGFRRVFVRISFKFENRVLLLLQYLITQLPERTYIQTNPDNQTYLDQLIQIDLQPNKDHLSCELSF